MGRKKKTQDETGTVSRQEVDADFPDGVVALMEQIWQTAFSDSRSNSVDAVINRMLASVGKFTGVSRAYVMLDENATLLRNTHEWVDGTAGPAMFSWPLHDYGRDIPSLKPMLEKLPYLGSHTRNMPPDLVNVLSRQAVDSVLLAPLIMDGKWIGLTGLDSCGREREWTEVEIRLIHFLGTTVTILLERKRLLERSEMLDRVLAVVRGLPDAPPAVQTAPAVPAPTVPLTIAEAERRAIVEAITFCAGNKMHAAKLLGLTWPALNRRCKKFGITVDRNNQVRMV